MADEVSADAGSSVGCSAGLASFVSVSADTAAEESSLADSDGAMNHGSTD